GLRRRRAAARRASGGRPPAPAPGAALAALDEVDDRRHALEVEALAQAVLDVVRVVAGDPGPGVDLDREAGRTLLGLGHEQQAQPVPAAAGAARGRLPGRDTVRQETIELRRRD